MATHPDPIHASPAVLRKLARENQEMGTRLAQLQYHAIMAELANPDLFELRIDFPNDPAPALVPPLMLEDPSGRRLPHLNVTLGNTAWVNDPSQLPVLGIFCPDETGAEMREALGALMTAHYTKPFARFVFLCESFRPIPFLGRYQLTYEHLGATPPHLVAARLHRRFDVQQIRHLLTGQLLWRAPSAEGPAHND